MTPEFGTPTSTNLLRFERFGLDLDSAELRRAGRVVKLPALPARLLCYLAANRHRTVSKRELAREIWGAVAIEEATLHQAVRAARRAVDDDGRRQRVIETAAGVGYRFIAETSEDPTLLASVRELPFVGQRALLAAAAVAIERTAAGRGAVLLIAGEAGAGKTRSAAEITRLANARGLLVVRGGASPHGGAPPFWPWIEAFRALSGLRALDDLRREAPHLVSTDPPGNVPPGESQRFRHFDVAARCLAKASEAGAFAVVLEDLHEANASTLELLDFVARRTTRVPLLLVATFRPRELARDSARVRTLASLEASTEVLRSDLKPLSPVETAYLVEQCSGRALPLERIGSLARHTGGNPFFAVELARILPDEATLQSDRAWENWVPQGAAQLLSQRLGQFGGGDSAALETAAAIGTSFDAGLLAQAAPELDCLNALAKASADGLVAELAPGSGGYRFAHALIRDALYAELVVDSDRRERTHLRIADAIAAAEPSREAEAAHHLCEAGARAGHRRIAAAVTSAAARASRSGDRAGAYALYERALRAIGPADDANATLRCELLVAAGKVGVRGIAPEEARGFLEDAIETTRRLALHALFARAVLTYAYRVEIVGLHDVALVELLEEASRGLADSEPALAAQLRSRAAVEVRYASEGLPRAHALIGEALERARGAGEPRALAQVLEDASLVEWSVADPEAWLALNHEIVSAANAACDIELAFQGWKGVATAYLELADRSGFEEAAGHCARIAGEFPSPFLQSVVSSLSAASLFLDGDFAAAEQATLVATANELGSIAPLAVAQLFYHRLETGRLPELEAATRGFVEESPGVVTWRAAFARLLADAGRFDEARSEVARLDDLDAIPRDRNWYPAMAMTAECAALLGDRELAAAVARQIEPHAGVSIALGNGALYYGSGAHFLGMLYTLLGCFDEAAEQLQAASEVHAAMASEPWQLRTLAEQALLAARRGDADSAHSLAAETSARARALGMVRCAERAEAARGTGAAGA